MNAYQDRTFIVGSNHDMIIKYYDEKGKEVDLSKYDSSYISFKNLINDRTFIIRNIVSFMQADKGILTVHIDSESFPNPTDKFFETNSNDSYGFGVPYHAFDIVLENKASAIKEVVFRGKATFIKAEYDGNSKWQSTEPPLNQHLTDLEQIIVRVNKNTTDIVSTRNLIGSLKTDVDSLKATQGNLQGNFTEGLKQTQLALQAELNQAIKKLKDEFEANLVSAIKNIDLSNIIGSNTIQRISRYENSSDESKVVRLILDSEEQAVATVSNHKTYFLGYASTGEKYDSFEIPAKSSAIVMHFRQSTVIQA